MSMGAPEATVAYTKLGNFILIHEAIIPLYDPPNTMTGESSASNFFLICSISLALSIKIFSILMNFPFPFVYESFPNGFDFPKYLCSPTTTSPPYFLARVSV